MPTIGSEVLLRREEATNGRASQESSPPSSMIRVDYQKKSLLESDRNSSSPSSIQEEFYTYLGISKANGDSDGDFQPTTTTPNSPLDEFDLSKRRSLRVRVVNKLKQHQAKLLKMAENSSTMTSPEKDVEFVRPEGDNKVLRKSSLLGQRLPSDELSINNDNHHHSPGSTTILERRCYTSLLHRSPSQSPSTTTNGLQSPSSSLFLISKLAGSGVGSPIPRQQSAAPSEIFSDFEEEIKKHVELSDRISPSTTTTTNTNDNTDNASIAPAVEPRPSEIVIRAPPPPIVSPSKTKQVPRIRKKAVSTTKRKRLVWPKALRERFLKTWSVTCRRKMLRMGNGAVSSAAEKVRPCSVRLNKLLPGFTVVRKAEDVKPYTVLDSDVPLESQPGPVLGTYYSDSDRVLLVVTERRVMFFQHHTNVAMFQKVVQGQAMPNAVGGGNANATKRIAWSLIDSIPRLQRDDVIDELMFEKRIMRVSGDGEHGRLVYVELRAQRLTNDYNHRGAEMAATYLNLYFLSRPTLDDSLAEQTAEVRSISLDTIVGSAPDIAYTVLPHDATVAMCWNERQPTRKRIGICKYKLSPDLESLARVEELQSVDGELNGLRWGEPKFVIGTGNSQIVIWDYHTGTLLTNIHLMDFELGETLYAQVLHVDKQERHLLLVQYWQNYLNVMHVNLLDFAYRVLKSRELTVTRHDVQSVVRLDSGDGANVSLGLVTGGGAGKEGGQEMLQIFDALTNRLVVMQRHEEEGSRLFLTDKYLIKLRLEPQTIAIQSVNEFLLNLI